ncbi:MAG: DUF2339 domain-containing protein, partial [Opitutus sp.]
MEAFITLLVIYLVFVLLILPIWMIIRIRGHSAGQETLNQRLDYIDSELNELRVKLRTGAVTTAAPTPAKPDAPPAPVPASIPIRPAIVAPPPIIVAATPPPPTPGPVRERLEPPPLPPVMTPAPGHPVYVPPPPLPPAINWEQFMGAKLIAWVGAFALFLGVAYFLQYSIEHGWIPNEVRVAMGFVFGAGLIVGGLRISREKYAITAQSLIAAGVVSLYAVTFMCGRDHYNFLGPVAMLLVMTLITTTAFFLAVRLEAQVVAILGLLGGFLTPVLLSTGVDNPPGLFGYLALLDAGLIAVVLATGWRHLVPLSAAGTVIMMLGWADRFFTAEKGPVAMTVCLGFSVLYQFAGELARRRGLGSPAFSRTAAALPLVGFGFGLYFLDYAGFAARAPLYLGYILLLDVLLLVQAWRDEAMPRLHLASGMVTFALMALWTAGRLTGDMLPWALTACLLFAALHTAFPLLLERHRPAASPVWWSQLFAPLTLLLLLLPIIKLDPLPFFIWPAILLVDLIAIGLAVLSASLMAVAAVMALTLLATGLFIFKVPASTALDPALLLIIGGFAVFFFAASLWVVRKLGARLPAGGSGAARIFGDARAQIPAFSSLLPFLLLIMVCARLPVPDPSTVFGLGLLLVALTLGLTLVITRKPFGKLTAFDSGSTGPAVSEGRQAGVEWLPACALAGMAALQYAWHARHFNPPDATLPLAWYAGFYAVFAAYPFLFRRTFFPLTGPWAVAALSGVAHCWMIHQAVKAAWPNDFPGLVPAVFALAPLASLALILKSGPADNPQRLNQLAWFGGVALLFITLIFPVQFDRQWLTVAWALEGAALLWLFHRVPHPGLRATGAVLLCTAFTRLALNPAVLGYHVRGETAVLNWYLYAYGIAIVALFAGARLTAPPRETVLGCNVPPLFNTLGTVLAFLLLNIEIADYFTRPGARSLVFQFSGNFGRDMTYTIAWALFALGLLGAGIWKKQKAARYAALALLSVTLLKLFFHDLARLEALYRIGALFAVAVIAILASFAYQRFQPSNEKSPPPAT